jgi:undecaprenyl-diphosphatase
MAEGICGKNPAGLKMLINLIIAFIPAAVVGLLCSKLIKEYLFNTYTVAYSWIIGGGVILAYCVWRSKQGKSNEGNQGDSLESMTTIKALVVGCLQCVAMVPGTSRSLMTMLGGMFVGLSVEAAVEFSFLLGLVTLGAATVHDAYKDGATLIAEFGIGSLILGTLVSWFSAWLAVRWMVSYLQKHSFAIFGWYRIAIGIATLILLSYMIIS